MFHWCVPKARSIPGPLRRPSPDPALAPSFIRTRIQVRLFFGFFSGMGPHAKNNSHTKNKYRFGPSGNHGPRDILSKCMNSHHVRIHALMRMYLDGPPNETCGWLYATLLERGKDEAFRAPSFYVFCHTAYVYTSSATSSEYYRWLHCGCCIVNVIRPCLRITCEFIHSCGAEITSRADTHTHLSVP